MAEIKNKYPYKNGFASVPDIADDRRMKKKTLYKRLSRARLRGEYIVSQDLFDPQDKRGRQAKIFSEEGIAIVDIARKRNLPYHTVLTRYNAGYRSAAALGAKVMVIRRKKL